VLLISFLSAPLLVIDHFSGSAILVPFICLSVCSDYNVLNCVTFILR